MPQIPTTSSHPFIHLLSQTQWIFTIQSALESSDPSSHFPTHDTYTGTMGDPKAPEEPPGYLLIAREHIFLVPLVAALLQKTWHLAPLKPY